MRKFNEIREENEKNASKLQEESKDTTTAQWALLSFREGHSAADQLFPETEEGLAERWESSSSLTWYWRES